MRTPWRTRRARARLLEKVLRLLSDLIESSFRNTRNRSG
jgi:hypothetical protein